MKTCKDYDEIWGYVLSKTFTNMQNLSFAKFFLACDLEDPLSVKKEETLPFLSREKNSSLDQCNEFKLKANSEKNKITEEVFLPSNIFKTLLRV